MNYYSEINRMATEKKDAALRGVLADTLFILLVGQGIQAEHAAICEELGSRWSNGASKVFIGGIALGDTTSAQSYKTRDGLSVFNYMIARHESDIDKLNYLNMAVRNIVRYAAEASGNLTNSRICMVSCADDNSIHLVAPACMLLNEYLYSGGGSVSRRQYYCFLPDDAYTSPRSLQETSRMCKSWENGPVPEERWFIVRDGTGQKATLHPCNRYIASKLFYQIVLLGRHDSDGELYDRNGARVRLFANLMDPESGIIWPQDQERCIYSAYTYPSAIDHGLDVVIAWRILHEKFLMLFEKRELPDLTPYNAHLRDAVKECAQSIARGMSGFCIYNGAVFEERCIGKSEKDLNLTQIEEQVFSKALLNKFNYLWISGMSKKETQEKIGAWKEATHQVLHHIWNEELLESISMEEFDEEVEQPQSMDMNKPVHTIDDLINLYINNVYALKNKEEIKRQMKEEFGPELKKSIENRRRELWVINDRIGKNNIINHMDNTQEQMLSNIRQFINDQTFMERRRKSVENLITEEDVNRYAQAVGAADYQNEIIKVLKGISAIISENLAPESLPEPDANKQKCACIMALHPNWKPLPHGYPTIQGGKGAGLYYLTLAIDPDNVLVLKEAVDRLEEAVGAKAGQS